MSNKICRILIALLLVQIVLVAYLNMGTQDLAVNTTKSDFFDFVISDVQEIKIAEKDQDLQISKKDGKWILPEKEGFIADQKLVEKTLRDLKQIKISSPVVTTLSAAKQLKTGVNDYEKKLTLKVKDQEVILFLGDTPTFKKIYGRLNGSDDTYILDYQSADLNISADSWFARDLLQFAEKDLDAIALNDLVLLKDEAGKLKFPEVEEGKVVDDNELNGLIAKLSELTYSEFPVSAAPKGWDDATLVIAYTLKIKGIDQTFEIKGPFKFKDGDQEKEKFYLKTNSLPYYFTLAKFEVDSLTAFNKAKMLKDKVESKEDKKS